jgi:hypothetical protein
VVATPVKLLGVDEVPHYQHGHAEVALQHTQSTLGRNMLQTSLSGHHVYRYSTFLMADHSGCAV